MPWAPSGVTARSARVRCVPPSQLAGWIAARTDGHLDLTASGRDAHAATVGMASEPPIRSSRQRRAPTSLRRAMVDQALAVLLEPGLVPGTHTRGLRRIGDQECEGDLRPAERQRHDAYDAGRVPTRLCFGVPVAHLPGNVDTVACERRSAGPFCAASASEMSRHTAWTLRPEASTVLLTTFTSTRELPTGARSERRTRAGSQSRAGAS